MRVPRVRLADENSGRSGREGRVGNTQYTLNCSKYPVSHTRSFFENLFRCIRCPLSFVTFGSLFECQGKSTEVIRNVEFVRYTRTRFR